MFNSSLKISPELVRRFQTISMCQMGYLGLQDASKILNLSYRQTKRLNKRLAESDAHHVTALMNKPRRAWNRTPDYVQSEIIKIKKQNPEISNIVLVEQIKKKLSFVIHQTTIREILIRTGLYKNTRVRRKAYRRFEAGHAGELVQMDTCEGCWLPGYRRLNLIMCLDDYSRAILSARIVESDNTWNNLIVLLEMVENWGIPRLLYTDNDSKFKLIRHKKDIPAWHPKPSEFQTEVQRALIDLGIAHLTHRPYQPQGKGKIERVFRFIQARLLINNKCKTLAGLNDKLQEWVSWYNAEHINRTTSSTARNRLDDRERLFKPVPLDINLDDVFCFKYSRIIAKDNSFSLNGQIYFIDHKFHLAQTQVDLHVMPDKQIRVFYRGKFIQTLKIN